MNINRHALPSTPPPTRSNSFNNSRYNTSDRNRNIFSFFRNPFDVSHVRSPSDNSVRPTNFLTDFNAVRSVQNEATEILENLCEYKDSLGLNEGHYLGVANDLRDMHANSTMTAENITQRLNALFDNPNPAQQAFLQECKDILKSPNNPS